MIQWDAQDYSSGIVRRYKEIRGEENLRDELLPDFPLLPPSRVKLLSRDRTTYFSNGIAAKPDRVYQHGSGLISIDWKSKCGSGRHPKPWNWRKRVRLDDCVQTILAAHAVAQNENVPVAALLRYRGAVVMTFCAPRELKLILDCARPAAELALGRDRFSDGYAPSEYVADYAALRLQRYLGRHNEAARRRGLEAHGRFGAEISANADASNTTVNHNNELASGEDNS